MQLWELSEATNEIAPIHGLNTEGVISFKDEATPEQRAAAQQFVDENLPNLSPVI